VVVRSGFKSSEALNKQQAAPSGKFESELASLLGN
jgi:hypothetical protein